MESRTQNKFQRTEMLIGHDALEKLKSSKVAVIGLGGVGSFVVEGLVRAGIGTIHICDNDVVDVTNINRQLFALQSTIGMYKTDVARDRIEDINPEVNVFVYKLFLDSDTIESIPFQNLDYIVDAIDSVPSKLLLIETSKKYDIPIISSMGTGNKLEPSRFEIADIAKTSVCPLARVIRTELRRKNISGVKVLYSREEPKKNINDTHQDRVQSSISFVPSVAGLMIAGEVIRDLIKNQEM